MIATWGSLRISLLKNTTLDPLLPQNGGFSYTNCLFLLYDCLPYTINIISHSMHLRLLIVKFNLPYRPGKISVLVKVLPNVRTLMLLTSYFKAADKLRFKTSLNIRKSLSRHEQVCLIRLRFEILLPYWAIMGEVSLQV